MKTIVAFCFILLGFSNVYAQSTATDPGDDNIFTIVQQQPKFPGNVNEWLVQNIVYPADAKNNNIQGTVYITFVIERDGSVSNVKVLRGVVGGSSLDNESIRVVSIMPKWVPGMQNGHTVRVQYTLPIHFVLKDDNSSGHANPTTISNSNRDKLVDTTYMPNGFKIIQVKPQFPGDINKYLTDHIKYPVNAKNNDIEGTVYVRFVVDKDGSVINASVMQAGNSDLDNEAIRVVSEMPKWISGTQNGHPVRVQYTLPIHFTINDNSSSTIKKN
jgi:TonB family protein